MKKIQLYKHPELIVLVDDKDFDDLKQFRWCLKLSTKGYPYACTYIGKYVVLMHRLITNTYKGEVVDHINGLGLDNRRENLRVCTPQENTWNQKLRSTNKSGVKGVHFDKKKALWRAGIRVNGKQIYLGRYKSLENAGSAYQRASREYYGRFAR